MQAGGFVSGGGFAVSGNGGGVAGPQYVEGDNIRFVPQPPNSVRIDAYPSGAVGEIQFRAAGAPAVFGASPDLFWDAAGLHSRRSLDLSGQIFAADAPVARISFTNTAITAAEQRVAMIEGGQGLGANNSGYLSFQVGSGGALHECMLITDAIPMGGHGLIEAETTLRCVGNNIPTSGSGLEMYFALFAGSVFGGYVVAYDRSANHYLPLYIGGDPIRLVGQINTSLPTSAAGLATGDLWNNGGVVNVV